MDAPAKLSGRVGLVTGAGRGAGFAIARALAGQGMAVGLLARGRERLDAAAAEIERAGGRALALVGDVRSWSDVEGRVAELVDRFGRLDLLVNNAAARGRGPAESVPLEEWRAAIETNLIGAYHCARAAIPHLRAAGGGWIIGIGSGAGRRGYAGMSAYSASKFGLLGLNESLAEELREHRIKVSTILPGSIATGAHAPGARYIEPEDVAQAVLALLAQPERAWTQEMNLWPF
jgi:3-oxoacyl-[acyl-carrier protein] reductase